jgi:hypothetical protein
MHAMTILISLLIWSGAQAAGETSSADAQQPDPFLHAESAVAQNLKTEDGRKYADSAAASGAKMLGISVRACQDSLYPGATGAKADSAGLDVYAMLSRRGMPKALLVRPHGKMEECLIAHLSVSLSFPNPPGPNYWIKLPSVH